MKNKELKFVVRLTLSVLTAVIFGAAISATNVSAQNASVFEVEVPFDFVVMGRTFEAAKYRIGRLNPSDPDTLVLNDSTGKTLLIVRTQRLDSEIPAEFSKLTFTRHGETNVLESVTASGSTYASRIPAARSERRRATIAAKTVSVLIR